jgi:hypothetical protein
VVEQGLFGTDDADETAALVDRWCRRHLGVPVAGARRWATSVGTVAVVALADGAEVAVKVHQADRSEAFLRGVQAVQRAVVQADVAAPSPLAGPAPIRDGGPLATAETAVADPGLTDGRAAGAVDAAATTLAVATRATASLPPDLLGVHPQETPPGRLWPRPHSPLFDFEATAAGAEWIDELARAARALLDAAPPDRPVLVHHDWCSRNVRVLGGQVVAAYDWDAVSPRSVAAAAGQAAALWPCTGEPDSADASTPGELTVFVEAFATAWGGAFGAVDALLAGAAALYTLCYSARCEHAVRRVDGAGTRALRAHGDSYLYAVGSS